MKKLQNVEYIYIVFIFDTVEYSNCLEDAYICFSEEQVDLLKQIHYSSLKRGFVDISVYYYELNGIYDYPIKFY